MSTTTVCTYNVGPLPYGGTCPECRHEASSHWNHGPRPCSECADALDGWRRESFMSIAAAMSVSLREVTEAFNLITQQLAAVLDADPALKRRMARAHRDRPERRRVRATWQHVDRRRRARRRR